MDTYSPDTPLRLWGVPVHGAGQTTGRKRILVVEDEPCVRMFVVRVLRSAGYAVEEAASGADAIRVGSAARADLVVSDLSLPDTTRPPQGAPPRGGAGPGGAARADLVVSDLSLPDTTGPKLVAALRGGSVPGVPALFVSGYSQSQAEADGLLPAGAAFLAKPFTLEDLKAAVGRLVA